MFPSPVICLTDALIYACEFKINSFPEVSMNSESLLEFALNGPTILLAKAKLNCEHLLCDENVSVLLFPPIRLLQVPNPGAHRARLPPQQQVQALPQDSLEPRGSLSPLLRKTLGPECAHRRPCP